MTPKPVVGFGGYEVTADGDVINIRSGRQLKPEPVIGGYLRVDLRFKGERKRIHVHRLVAEAFIGPKPEGTEVEHLDGNPRNNHYSNLKYSSHAENMDRKKLHGTLPMGQKHHAALFTDDQYQDIINSDESHAVCAARYGVSKSCIVQIRRRDKLRRL